MKLLMFSIISLYSYISIGFRSNSIPPYAVHCLPAKIENPFPSFTPIPAMSMEVGRLSMLPLLSFERFSRCLYRYESQLLIFPLVSMRSCLILKAPSSKPSRKFASKLPCILRNKLNLSCFFFTLVSSSNRVLFSRNFSFFSVLWAYMTCVQPAARSINVSFFIISISF